MKPRNKFRGYHIVRAYGTISKDDKGMADIVTVDFNPRKTGKSQPTKNAVGMTDIVTARFNSWKNRKITTNQCIRHD